MSEVGLFRVGFSERRLLGPGLRRCRYGERWYYEPRQQRLRNRTFRFDGVFHARTVAQAISSPASAAARTKNISAAQVTISIREVVPACHHEKLLYGL